MAETLLEQPDMIVEAVPDMSHIITEDDEPVDNVFSEKQQRLLVEPLYSSWQSERPFFAAANVGVFYATHQPPLVPDMFLSLDVQPDEDIWRKENRSYFLWKFGKPPEVVIEVVSNRKGGETEKKFRLYARMGVWYYVIFDPEQLVLDTVLQVYGLSIARYLSKPDLALTEVDLKLTLWEGVFEGLHTQWLRWCDAEGNLLLTGSEQAAHEHQRAERERQRAERLVEQLRALGVEPENGKKI